MDVSEIGVIPGYMAMSFGASAQWYSSEQSITLAQLPVGSLSDLASKPDQAAREAYIAAQSAEGPPDRSSYFEVRAYSAKVEREYQGTGSSGGPNPAFRSSHSNVQVEKLTDKLSPHLLECCLVGNVVPMTHLVSVGAHGKLIHIRITGAYIANYEFSATRFLHDLKTSGTDSEGAFDKWTATTRECVLVDKFELYYTARSAHVRVLETDGTLRLDRVRGWDTGLEQPWTGWTPPAANAGGSGVT